VELGKNVFALMRQIGLKPLPENINKESVPGQDIGVQKNWQSSVMKLLNRTLPGLVQSRVEFQHVLIMKVPIQYIFGIMTYQQAAVRFQT